MQPVLERGSIYKPPTFDVGLIQLSFIPVCSPNACNISVKMREGLHFSAFHYYSDKVLYIQKRNKKTVIKLMIINNNYIQYNYVKTIKHICPIMLAVSIQFSLSLSTVQILGKVVNTQVAVHSCTIDTDCMTIDELMMVMLAVRVNNGQS